MRLLHLLWPHLPLRLARKRWEIAHSTSFPTGPVVLGGQPWTDGQVVDMSPAARETGVRRGIPLGSAHRLAPEAIFLDPDPEADAAVVEAALDRLGDFSPGVAGVTDSADPGFGLLEVQVDGLQRLWGEEAVLVTRLREGLRPVLPGRPKAGIAGTRFAATLAAATAGRSPAGVPPGGEAAFLEPFPAALLTPDRDVRARLARFGLERIGMVAELPRSALIARFGDEGARMHARARGEELVPFRPRRAPERLLLALPLEPGVADLEPLRFVLRRLVGALADQLQARGAAALRAHLRLELDVAFAPDHRPAGLAAPEPDPPGLAAPERRRTPERLVFEQRLPEPTAEAEAIERLLYAQLERMPPPAPVARLELELAEVGPAAGQQLPLFVPQAGRAARLGWQLARLALTFGEDRIRRVELADPEAPLPEARWKWVPVESGAGQAAVEATTGPGLAP